MVKWPGKETEAPFQRKDNKYVYTIKTTMPCGTSLKNSDAQDTLQSAYNKAERALNASVRRHLGTCKKCPADIMRP
jgi:hypothetical protein